MGEVIQFPSDRDWPVFRQVIDEILIQAGIGGEKDRTAICERIKPRFDRLKASFNMSVTIPAECLSVMQEMQEAVAGFVHEVSNKALMQIVELETALYFAESGT